MTMDDENKSTWNEWSRYVLKELEKLNSNSDYIKSELSEMKNDIFQIKNFSNDITELKRWKQETENVLNPLKFDVADTKAWKVQMMDAASPKQIADNINEVAKLKTFKTQAVTIWLVIQVITGLAFAILGVVKH
jgi:hypothetical protein